EVLKVLRQPEAVKKLLENANLPVLEIRVAENAPPQNGTWVKKPCRGSAGRGIEIWGPPATDASIPNREQGRGRGHYFQRYQAGTPISALYLALPGRTWLLG